MSYTKLINNRLNLAMNNNESLKVKDIYDNASDGFGSVVMDMQENLLKARYTKCRVAELHCLTN